MSRSDQKNPILTGAVVPAGGLMPQAPPETNEPRLIVIPTAATLPASSAPSASPPSAPSPAPEGKDDAKVRCKKRPINPSKQLSWTTRRRWPTTIQSLRTIKRCGAQLPSTWGEVRACGTRASNSRLNKPKTNLQKTGMPTKRRAIYGSPGSKCGKSPATVGIKPVLLWSRAMPNRAPAESKPR